MYIHLMFPRKFQYLPDVSYTSHCVECARIRSLYGKIRVRKNLYSGIFYSVQIGTRYLMQKSAELATLRNILQPLLSLLRSLKKMKNAFRFILKALFVCRVFKSFSSLFDQIEKTVSLKIEGQFEPGQQTITTNTLTTISQIKGNHILNGIKVRVLFGKIVEKKHLCRHDKNHYYFQKSNIPVINLIVDSRNMIKVSKNMHL